MSSTFFYQTKTTEENLDFHFNSWNCQPFEHLKIKNLHFQKHVFLNMCQIPDVYVVWECMFIVCHNVYVHPELKGLLSVGCNFVFNSVKNQTQLYCVSTYICLLWCQGLIFVLYMVCSIHLNNTLFSRHDHFVVVCGLGRGNLFIIGGMFFLCWLNTPLTFILIIHCWSIIEVDRDRFPFFEFKAI